MANKMKMRCAVCQKTFKSSKPTQLLCDDCERKRRQEKGTVAVARPAQTTPQPAAVSAGAKPAWLEKAIVRDTMASTATPAAPSRERAPRPTTPASQAPQHSAHGEHKTDRIAPPATKKPAKPPEAHATKPATPKTPRQPKEPAKPVALLPEQIAAVEQRYIELAKPEFDGIRTQIAQELGIPKKTVKRIVAGVRERMQIPSWWEVQSYTGSPDDLERVKAAYTPHLPVPPLGIHKQIARDLNLSSAQAYHAIRAVRLSMGLPVFNPPDTHPELQKAAAKAEA
jgi:hypothetical protein